MVSFFFQIFGISTWSASCLPPKYTLKKPQSKECQSQKSSQLLRCYSKRARLNRPSSTLLDPRLKSIGFDNQGKAQAQCFKWITTPPYPNTQTHTQSNSPPYRLNQQQENAGLCCVKCKKGMECYRSCKKQWCMSDPPLARSEEVPQTCLPQPFQVGQKICWHSSVPCESVLPKCGEIVRKKRNQLHPNNVENNNH